MTITETATVEVLTAEVRVLGRAPTDHAERVPAARAVGTDDIEPFGASTMAGASSRGIFVVGRRNGTGELVRSSVAGTTRPSLTS